MSKKSSKQITILMAILAFCLAVYLGIIIYNRYLEKKNSHEETKVVESISPLSTKINHISYSYNGNTYSFTAELDPDLPLTKSTWTCDDPSDFPVADEPVRRIAYACRILQPVRKLDLPDDLALYGLDEETRQEISLSDADGNKFDLWLGNLSGDKTNYYVMEANGKCAYTISSALHDAVAHELYEFIDMPIIPPTTSDTVLKYDFEYKGKKLVIEKEVTKTEHDDGTSETVTEWYAEKDGKRTPLKDVYCYDLLYTKKVNESEGSYGSTYLSDTLDALKAPMFTYCCNYKPDDAQMKECGLGDDEAFILTVEYEHQVLSRIEPTKYVLRIGHAVNPLNPGDKDSFSHFYANLEGTRELSYLEADIVVPILYLFGTVSGTEYAF